MTKTERTEAGKTLPPCSACYRFCILRDTPHGGTCTDQQPVVAAAKAREAGA